MSIWSFTEEAILVTVSLLYCWVDSEGSPQNPRVLIEVLFVLQEMMFFSFCDIW